MNKKRVALAIAIGAITSLILRPKKIGPCSPQLEDDFRRKEEVANNQSENEE